MANDGHTAKHFEHPMIAKVEASIMQASLIVMGLAFKMKITVYTQTEHIEFALQWSY